MRSDRRLRRPTLVAAPLFLVGVMAATGAVATGLWAAWNPDALGTTFYVVEVVTVVLATAAFIAASGCSVVVDDRGDVRDVVAWVTRRRFARSSIVTTRVRSGAWRWFEVELDDGSLHVLLGASPAQFPTYLMPGSDQRDLADLALLGADPSAPSAPGGTAVG